MFLVVAVAAAWAMNSPQEGDAGHHTRYINVMAPFSGYWDKFGAAPPSSHDRGVAIPGDWATDYYQVPGWTGRWYTLSSDGSGHIGKVGLRNNACNAAGWSHTGLRYRFDLYWSSAPTTKIGHFGYIRVDPRIPGMPYDTFFLNLGETPAQGREIGWTLRYAYHSVCWQVTVDAEVHWHVLGYNVSHYSCFHNWGAGAYLTQAGNGLGAVNVNILSARQPCG